MSAREGGLIVSFTAVSPVSSRVPGTLCALHEHMSDGQMDGRWIRKSTRLVAGRTPNSCDCGSTPAAVKTPERFPATALEDGAGRRQVDALAGVREKRAQMEHAPVPKHKCRVSWAFKETPRPQPLALGNLEPHSNSTAGSLASGRWQGEWRWGMWLLHLLKL